MPKINTYTNASPISGSDKLVGTDASSSNMTKNFLISDLKAFIVDTPILGSFYSTTNQIAILTNTAYAMEFDTTDTVITNGVSLANNSELVVSVDGVYNLQFSAQLDRVSGSGTDTIDIWFRKNGVNIPNSNTRINMTGNLNSCKTVAAWNFMLDMNANDYVEIMWASTTTNIELIYAATSSPHPATPSVIATINKIA